MNNFDKPLADLDGLIEELATVKSSLLLLTTLIENGILPNQKTFAEALNAESSHIGRIEKDASAVLEELLDLTRSEHEESSQVANIIQP